MTPEQAAAAEMREKAAQICASVNNHDNPMTANDCADAIRAIPIPETKADDPSEPCPVAFGWPHKYPIGTLLRKVRGSQWRGPVVGFYSTENTPEGYVIMSTFEYGSVQAWPAAALEPWTPEAASEPKVDPRDEALKG
jgi:hypothetical protein